MTDTTATDTTATDTTANETTTRPIICFEQVAVTYPEAEHPTISGVNLGIEEGELCVVVGRTGTGKSTLLGCINGH